MHLLKPGHANSGGPVLALSEFANSVSDFFPKVREPGL